MGLIRELKRLLGAERVLSSDLQRWLYGTDSGITRGQAAAVVLPEHTDEVVELVEICRKFQIPMVPRGSGTGLAGGAVPARPAVIVSTTRMNQIYQIDPENRSAWVGPGVINLDLSEAAHKYGLHFAPDPSSQSICTIGGNVANNSGGPHCLAEGSTSNHIMGLEVVTSSAEILELGGNAPDPIGLNLVGVLVGSEGTLGMVTKILVKLTPNPPAVRTQLIAYDTVGDAAATVSDIIASGLVPAALEMMDQGMIRAVENWLGAGLDTQAAALLLTEVSGTVTDVSNQSDLIAGIASQHRCRSIRTASSADEREELWRGRKAAFGAVAQTAPNYYLHDTVVPRTKLVTTLNHIYAIGERYGLDMLNVFHAGDGNLHPLITYDADNPELTTRVMSAAQEMVEYCVEQGGSLSGEHGIGQEKRELMHRMFTAEDLEMQSALKTIFDPELLFNPDKILPENASCFDRNRPASHPTSSQPRESVAVVSR